ncbi:MAG: phage tail tube protein [Rhodospirillaceae bacterium]
MSRAIGANAQLLGKFEATYGTAPTGNYARLPFISCDLGSEQPLEANDVLGLGRDPPEPSRGVVTAQGNVVVPVDLRDIGLWLKGLFGLPTTTGTAPAFSHVFTSGATALPSLALEVGMPDVPRYFLNTGCMVDSIKFPWATSGKANATVAVIAQGEANAATTGGGTPTSRVLRRFQQSMGVVRKDGVALGNVTGGELTYANKLSAVRTIRDDGKIDGCDLGVAACTGQISVRFADTVLLDAASSGTPVTLSLGWIIDTDKSLMIDLPAVYLPKAKNPISGPGGIEAKYNWQAAKPASGAFVTVTLKNDIESYA